MGDLYYRITWSPETITPIPPPEAAGTVLEGYEFPKGLHVDSTALPLFYQIFRGPFNWPKVDMGLACKALLLAQGFVLIALLYGAGRVRSTRLTLALIAVFLVDSEYLLPQRWEYVDIMFVVPLGLSFPYLRSSLKDKYLFCLFVLLGLAIGHSPPWVEAAVSMSHYFINLARSLLLMGASAGLVMSFWLGRTRRVRSVGMRDPLRASELALGRNG